MKEIGTWLLHNGIGQNVSAGGLMGTPTAIYARRRFIKHMEAIHLHIELLGRQHEPKN